MSAKLFLSCFFLITGVNACSYFARHDPFTGRDAHDAQHAALALRAETQQLKRLIQNVNEKKREANEPSAIGNIAKISHEQSGKTVSYRYIRGAGWTER